MKVVFLYVQYIRPLMYKNIITLSLQFPVPFIFSVMVTLSLVMILAVYVCGQSLYFPQGATLG